MLFKQTNQNQRSGRRGPVTDSSKLLRWCIVVGLLLCLVCIQGASAYNAKPHYDIAQDALRDEGISDPQNYHIAQYDTMVDIITSGHEDSFVDFFFIPHIDDDLPDDWVQCVFSNKAHFQGFTDTAELSTEWDRFQEGTYQSVKAAERNKNPRDLLITLGMSLHTVQDFYAHSNWADLTDERAIAALNLSVDYSGDVTWFDVTESDRNTLGDKLYSNQPHATLNKDYPSRLHYDTSYREAYYASRQWIRLVKSWVSDDFWNTAMDPQTPHTGNSWGGNWYSLFWIVSSYAGKWTSESRNHLDLVGLEVQITAAKLNPDFRNLFEYCNPIGVDYLYNTYCPACESLCFDPEYPGVDFCPPHPRVDPGLPPLTDGAHPDQLDRVEKVRWLKIRTWHYVANDADWPLSEADIYSKVYVRGHEYREAPLHDDDERWPRWEEWIPLPMEAVSVTSRYELWDDDFLLSGTDDPGDLNPIPGEYDWSGTMRAKSPYDLIETQGNGDDDTFGPARVSFSYKFYPQAVAKIGLRTEVSPEGIHPGEPVTYTYTVTNQGDFPLGGINIESGSDQVGPVFLSGDTDGNGFLDRSETWTYTATVTWASSTDPAITYIYLDATATGTDISDGTTVFEQSGYTVYILHPTVTGISPNTSAAGATLTDVYVYGTNFKSGAEVFIGGGIPVSTNIDATNENVINSTTIRCTLAIPGDAHAGPYSVYVTNPGEGTISKNNAFMVTGGLAVITGLSPASASPGETIIVDVSGGPFVSGVEVYMWGGSTGGWTEIYATNENVINSTTIRCTLAIPVDAYPGPYAVGVRNPGSFLAYGASVFTVTAPTPTVTGISPDNTTMPFVYMNPVYVYGTGFTNGVEVYLLGGTDGTTKIDLWSRTFINLTTIQCGFIIPPDAYPGPYDVYVRNPAGNWVSRAAAFTLSITPTVTGIYPGTAERFDTLPTVYVYGTNFMPGAEVNLAGGIGVQTGIDATNETRINSTTIRCSLFMHENVNPGPYHVYVKNPGNTGWNAYKPDAFTVVPTPTVTGISPTSGYTGTTLTDVYVYGTNFRSGAEVAIVGPEAGMSYSMDAADETVINSTTIQCNLTIRTEAGAGLYNVLVKNPGSEHWVEQMDRAFTVLPSLPNPTVTGISPTSGYTGTTLTDVYVYGTNFRSGAEVAIVGPETGMSYSMDAADETVINSTTIQCNLTIRTEAGPGLYDVLVKNPGSENWYSKNDAFTILPSLPNPTVTGISPDIATVNSTLTDVYVYGTNFVAGTEVQLRGCSGAYCTEINATDEIVINATTIRCSLAIPWDAIPGLYTLYVELPGTGADAFIVDVFTVLPPPTVTGISPNSAVLGTTLPTVYIYGTNFLSGTEVWISGGTGVSYTMHATNETVINATTIRCSLAVQGNASTGSYSVYVTPPGNGFGGSKNDAFTVLPRPLTVTGISPAWGIPGTTVSVTITGTEFGVIQSVKLVRFGIGDIPGTNDVRVSPTTITCDFVIPSTAPTGARAVRVTIIGGKSASLFNGFTVTRANPEVLPDKIGVFRSSAHTFYLKNGTTTTAINWGASTDLPVTGDWNGDGRTKVGVFRNSTHMFYLKNGTSTTTINWGASTDLPVTGDWNGDGRTEVGVFRNPTHTFYLKNGTTTMAISWGASTDKPVTGDWNGDGRTEVGVFRPSVHTFYLKNGTTTTAINWGTSTDKPVTGDWNGDGKTEVGVFRPSVHTFYLKNGTTTTAISWGASTDLPVTGKW